MAPPVFFVHLRRPRSATVAPDERRDDPFYEFGSFGCTGCHRGNLFHLRNAENLQGARLAFVQGGHLGFRLVYLTPPIKVQRWTDRCEAKWEPAGMPFRYGEAPVLVWNGRASDFSAVQRFAGKADRTTIEGALSSLLRTRAKPLPPPMAAQVVSVYEQRRAAPGAAISTSYEEALPYLPPVVDPTRRATYEAHIRRLKGESEEGDNGPRKTAGRVHCRPRSRRCR